MTKTRPTDGYSERLKQALESGPKPMSVRALAAEMEAGPHKHLRGASYGGIRQYVEGRVTNPRIELLRALADVLDVRAEWLAYGNGPTTAAELEARRPRDEDLDIPALIARERASKTDADHMDELFRDTRAGWLLWDEAVRWRVADVFGRWHAANVRFAELNESPAPSVKESAEAFAALVSGPVYQWYQAGLGLSIHPARQVEYVHAILSAIASAIPDGRDFSYMRTSEGDGSTDRGAGE